MRRFLLVYVAPTLVLAVLAMLPVVLGSRTLYERDVLQAHLGMKVAQSQAWRDGYMPEIDPYRAGGQPLAGNPNSVPFYPDNLLFLVAPVLWALNAHFWLHLLIAPLAAFWLGRAWGLSRPGAWAVGVCYGFSGYFLSQLSFYNLIAGVALAPALVAACLRVQAKSGGDGSPQGTSGRGRLLVAVGGLWALMVLSGDPLMALLAFLLAASAVWARARTLHPGRLLRRVPILPLALVFVGGTLLAAPQWIEFLRILPLSFRGHFGYGGGVGAIESFDPRQMIEWLVPLSFGRPDLVELGCFWGWDFYTGFPPYYFSLYPGLLAMILVAASGRPRRPLAFWGWGAILSGLFFALGGFNPGAAWLFDLGLLRYPVKLWLTVAMGASLLCGVGFERVFHHGRRRVFALGLGLCLALYLGVLVSLQTVPAARAGVRAMIPPSFSEHFVDNEVARWSGLALFTLMLLALVSLAFFGLRRRPQIAGALLLLVHVGSQLFFLAPLRATDSPLPYLSPPPALAQVPERAQVVHGSYLGLFGPKSFEVIKSPGPQTYWYTRRTFFELYPVTGSRWHRRYQLNVSPEGLDGFLTEIARSAVENAAGDLERLRLLRAWGVEYLLLGRELAPDARHLVAETSELPVLSTHLWIYRIADPAPEVFFASRVVSVPHVNAAVDHLIADGFDPSRSVVIPGDEGEESSVEDGAGGTARFLTRGPESFEVEVNARSSGILVVQRAHLDLWQVTVRTETPDGTWGAAHEGDLLPADVHRLGVPLPPGHHRVRFWIDRRPLALSAVVAVVGALVLAALAWIVSKPPRARPETEPG